MSEYVVVIEKGDNGFGAYAPDLPGCVAVGATLEETELLMREALALHIASLRAHGEQIPEPSAAVRSVVV